MRPGEKPTDTGKIVSQLRLDGEIAELYGAAEPVKSGVVYREMQRDRTEEVNLRSHIAAEQEEFRDVGLEADNSPAALGGKGLGFPLRL